ncbi:hypothetical protein GF345_01280 [Candidatus Woesearchaeota archaeon]|nr:hypothetical protein [Candidatus Woesearchaeota archaeon]
MKNLRELMQEFSRKKDLTGCFDDNNGIADFSAFLDMNRYFIVDPEDLLYAADNIKVMKRPKSTEGSALASEIMTRYVASITPEEHYGRAYSAIKDLNTGNDQDEEKALSDLRIIGEDAVSRMVEGIMVVSHIIDYTKDNFVMHYFNNTITPTLGNLQWANKEIKKE